MNNFKKFVFFGVAMPEQPITINGLTFTIFDQTEENKRRWINNRDNKHAYILSQC